ncbi:hypothetical protein [Methylorubrum sp. SL192]|uniref:hypothetical protein n=1 Tax=Methylorubrum sp. SL192 TaxID=2995167 RepID=UPI0006FBD98F|nr:hypothetical protein [Methylorubrum sp. SL192]KQO89441.1 hypothetical protein ASF33_19105 [Methylobacterium sp. Leaf92]MCY1644937.1 hypothetical protein [Methylorubrum sp. SL192]
MTSGEILTVILSVTLPLLAIGTVIWRQASTQSELRASIRSVDEKAGSASEGVKRVESSVATMRDELHREYVRQDSQREMEARISKRMDDVEHTVRNTATTIIAALSGTEPLPRRRRPTP